MANMKYKYQNNIILQHKSSLLHMGNNNRLYFLFDLFTLLSINFVFRVCTWRIQWGVELAVVGWNTEHVVYGAVLALLQMVQGHRRGMMEGGQRGPGVRGQYSPEIVRKEDKEETCRFSNKLLDALRAP